MKLARELAYEAQVYNKKKAEELWEILDAKHGQRRFVPGIPPGFNIGDRVPVQPRRFRQVAFRVWPTNSAASCSDEALIGMRPMIGSARLLRLSKDRPTSPGVFIGGTGRRGLGHNSVLCKQKRTASVRAHVEVCLAVTRGAVFQSSEIFQCLSSVHNSVIL